MTLVLKMIQTRSSLDLSGEVPVLASLAACTTFLWSGYLQNNLLSIVLEDIAVTDYLVECCEHNSEIRETLVTLKEVQERRQNPLNMVLG